MSQLLTEDELAKELKVSRNFLWTLRRKGLGPLRNPLSNDSVGN